MYKNRILFLFLILSLGCSFATKNLWAQPQPDLSRLETEGRQIRDTLYDLLLRIKNPNTLGVKGLSPQEFQAQLRATEDRLVAWKNELSPIVNGAFDAKQKAKIIAFYFSQYSILVQVRVLAKESHGNDFPIDESWQGKFSFPVTAQALYELSGDSPLNLVTAPQSLVKLDIELEALKHVKPSTLFPLQLSGLHIQALRQMALSNEVTPENYFSLIQSLMVGWLLESLDKTHVFMRGKKRVIPPLKGFEEIQKNIKIKKEMSREREGRELLIQTFPEIATFFADDPWIQKLVVLLAAPESHEQYFQILKEGFQKSEPVDAKETFTSNVRQYPLPIGHLSLEEKTALLKKWYTQARFSVILALMPESNDWTEETKTAIIHLLQKRLSEYEALLPSEPFKMWAEASEQNEAYQEAFRLQYVLTLMDLAKKLQDQMKLSKDELPLDLITLDMALEKDFLMMGIEPATLQRKMMIVQSASIPEAKTLYEVFLKELKESVQTTSKPKGQSFSERVQAKAYEKLEKELKELSKVGEWFFGKGSPLKLGDLPLTDAQKEAYQEMANIRKMGEHHILTMVGGIEEKPLYERLARLDSKNENNMAMGGCWVDAELEKIEAETLEKINTATQATSIEDIKTIVAKSPLLHAMMSQYPTFTRHHEAFKKKALSPNFAEMSWDELFHRTTYPGFTFLLLHWIAKFVPGVRTHPLMRAVDAAIGPYLSYFLITSFSMVGVDAVWQYERIEDKEEDIELLEEYLDTSSGDDSFSDLLTVTRAQEERDMMWSQWKSQRAFEVVFLVGIPVLGRAAKGLIGKARDGYYAKLYKQVGFESGKYSWNEMDIRAMSRATVQRIRSEHPSNKKLQEWLIGRVEGAERKLLKIIQRAEKSMKRKSRHFREEFEALRLEEGQWDPVAIVTSLERMKALHQGKLISQEALDQALRAAQELLREVRIPLMGLNLKGPTADLQRRLIFIHEATSTQVQVNGKPIPAWVDEAAQYTEEGFTFLDPVLERTLQKSVGADGREIEIMTYKRVSPYVPRKWWP